MPPFRPMMLFYRLKRRIHDVQSETMGAYSQHCGLLALEDPLGSATKRADGLEQSLSPGHVRSPRWARRFAQPMVQAR